MTRPLSALPLPNEPSVPIELRARCLRRLERPTVVLPSAPHRTRLVGDLGNLALGSLHRPPTLTLAQPPMAVVPRGTFTAPRRLEMTRPLSALPLPNEPSVGMELGSRGLRS